MREVLYKKYIIPEYEIVAQVRLLKEGTGVMQKDFTQRGFFHTWISTHEGNTPDIGTYIVAIVENLDGTIISLRPENIKFICPPNQNL